MAPWASTHPGRRSKGQRKVFASWPRRAGVYALQGERGAANTWARPSWDSYQRRGGNELEGCGQSPTTLLAKVTQTCLTSHSEQLPLNCPGSPASMGSSNWVTCRTLIRLCEGSSLPCMSPCSHPGTTLLPVLLKPLPQQPHASLPIHHVRHQARLKLFLSTSYLISVAKWVQNNYILWIRVREAQGC